MDDIISLLIEHNNVLYDLGWSAFEKKKGA
jgi:hypothetical protein